MTWDGTGGDCCCPPVDCCCNPTVETWLADFTAGGITNGTETGCTILNSKFCLCYINCDTYGTARRLVTNVGPFTGDCPDDVSGILMNLLFECVSNRVRLYVYARCFESGEVLGLMATYEKSRASWNCGSSNTMSKVSSSGDCATWPATVTVTPDTNEYVCRCDCNKPTPPQTAAYELIAGPFTSDSCDTCHCSVLEMRICMQADECLSVGDWNHRHYWDLQRLTTGSVAVPALDYPGGCAPGFAVNSPTAIMQFDAISDSVIVRIGSGTNYVRYSLDADLFDPMGNNTLSLLDSVSLTCTPPATIQLNFLSSNANGNRCTSYPCDVFSVMSQGWTFVISGVDGPEYAIEGGNCRVRPCRSLNGTWCLGSDAGDCFWYSNDRQRIGLGFGPTPVKYRDVNTGDECGFLVLNPQSVPDGSPWVIGPETAESMAVMGINGGVVFLQIATLVATGSGALNAIQCVNVLHYEIALSDFDPVGENTLTLRCSQPLRVSNLIAVPSEEVSSCVCTGVPSTIVISPSTSCGTPPPAAECICLPKASYSPRILMSGILDDSCTDCGCVTELDLCFAAYGDTSACTWRADISIPTSAAIACVTNATYAILSIGVSPNTSSVVLALYNASNAVIAQFSGSLAAFTCDDTAFSMAMDSQSDACDWSAATVLLNMHGAACATCICTSKSWSITINYSSVDYTFCIGVGSCSGTSGVTAPISGGGGASLYIVVELGELPALFARVLVYYLASGGSIGSGTLIGVYNYLSAMSSFSCSAANTLHLATGNTGQCGYLVDETGFTEHLALATTLSPFTCGTEGNQTITTPGTYVICTESGKTYTFEGWASGGGGKGGTPDSRNGGGGGGAYAKVTWTSNGSSVIIVIPAGGASSTGAGNAGSDFTVTVVSSGTVICRAKGGGGGTASIITGAQGGQSSSCVGDTKFSGGDGGVGEATSGVGGGGGSSAGTAANGNPGQNGDAFQPAAGGTAPSGGGNGGQGGDAGSGSANGVAGSAPGGGGGAGHNSAGGTGAAGGNGKGIITCT